MASKKKKSLGGKELIVFDLDGTLTESKSDLRPEMSRALVRLLEKKRVAVIGGGTYKQFRTQFVSKLHCPTRLLSKLYLFPTTATSFYRYNRGWKKVYLHELSKKERRDTMQAFKDVFKEVNYVPPKKTYGRVIEDRGTQITFSALGQDIVAALGNKGIKLKEEWRDKNTPLKLEMAKLLQRRLPTLTVRASSFTSIDITRKGIDKAFGLKQIEKYLGVKIKDMVFVGDALSPGGNDYAARRTGVDCIPVKGPKDTERVINKIIGR